MSHKLVPCNFSRVKNGMNFPLFRHMKHYLCVYQAIAVLSFLEDVKLLHFTDWTICTPHKNKHIIRHLLLFFFYETVFYVSRRGVFSLNELFMLLSEDIKISTVSQNYCASNILPSRHIFTFPILCYDTKFIH